MVKFANMVFRGLTREDVFLEREGLSHIITVNAEYIVKANENEKLREIINSNIATFDGQVPYAIARWKFRKSQFDKIPGSELIYDICMRAMQRGERVFLLGGMEDSNALSVNVLGTRYPGLTIEGYSPPIMSYPFQEDQNESILIKLRDFRPDFVLVAFGVVKQDYWIDDNRKMLEHIGVKFAVGVGGAFEMVSGKLKRAPRLFQIAGLEGVYRLLKEPKFFRLKRLMLSLRIFRYI